MTGTIGGAQAGYNWQVGTFVLGVETDLQGSKIGGSKTNTSLLHNDGTGFNPGTYASQQQDLDWLGTLRARAGVLVAPSLLTYVTGGLAYGKVSYSSIVVSTNSGSTFATSESDTKTGWTVGGGIEWAIDRNWSLKGEYLYYDLGDITMVADPSPANPPFQIQSHIETRGSIGRVGLNYKF